MKTISITQINLRDIIKPLYVGFVLAVVYFVPAISHATGYPLYLLEPMRFFLILSIALFDKRISYLLALTIPLFSFMVSGHPLFLKMIIISIELISNVYLYYLLFRVTKNAFAAAFLSILGAKTLYYGLKYLLIISALMATDMVATPLLMQLMTTILFSIIVFIVPFFADRLKKKKD